MLFMRLFTCVAATLCLTQLQAHAGPSERTQASSGNNFMRVHGQALPPFGYVQFCRRYNSECVQRDNVGLSRFNATPADLAKLDLINRKINHDIKPITDLQLYGVEEYWTFPTTQGDCEDYVVLKRHVLMQNGWPASALLITVVRDEQGEGHAVLTVRTKQGDYVLDNKVNEVRLWNQTPYKYLMRQSYLNPKLWMALDPKAMRAAGSVAGVTKD